MFTPIRPYISPSRVRSDIPFNKKKYQHFLINSWKQEYPTTDIETYCSNINKYFDYRLIGELLINYVKFFIIHTPETSDISFSNIINNNFFKYGFTEFLIKIHNCYKDIDYIIQFDNILNFYNCIHTYGSTLDFLKDTGLTHLRLYKGLTIKDKKSLKDLLDLYGWLDDEKKETIDVSKIGIGQEINIYNFSSSSLFKDVSIGFLSRTAKQTEQIIFEFNIPKTDFHKFKHLYYGATFTYNPSHVSFTEALGTNPDYDISHDPYYEFELLINIGTKFKISYVDTTNADYILISLDYISQTDEYVDGIKRNIKDEYERRKFDITTYTDRIITNIEKNYFIFNNFIGNLDCSKRGGKMSSVSLINPHISSTTSLVSPSKTKASVVNPHISSSVSVSKPKIPTVVNPHISSSVCVSKQTYNYNYKIDEEIIGKIKELPKQEEQEEELFEVLLKKLQRNNNMIKTNDISEFNFYLNIYLYFENKLVSSSKGGQKKDKRILKKYKRNKNE